MCKLFRCLPTELDMQDAETIDLYVAFYNAEEQVKEINRKAAEEKANGKGKGRK